VVFWVCSEDTWSTMIRNVNTNQAAWCHNSEIHNMDKLNIFGNRVPRKMSGIKEEEISQQVNLLHKDINWIYSSPCIKVMKSRRLQCARHAARIVEK